MQKTYPNKYPIFVISYNRAKNNKTSKTLANFGVYHYLIIHKEQIAEYKQFLTPEQKKYTAILEFDDKYKYQYETCDNIPHSVKNAGSGAERNFAWDYSIKLGAKAHWLMDDNIKNFMYIAGICKRNNTYVRRICNKEKFWELFPEAEKFFDKYENLLMMELTQNDFCIQVSKLKYMLNTRCFSCNLIWNDMPLRWRGRYNEDVILSYDIMNAGYCIASYKGILKQKQSTREAVGGNHAVKSGDTNSLYSDGFDYKHSSADKTNLLLKVYPQYFRKVIKYGRVHHDYIRNKDMDIYKMKLKKANIIGEKNIHPADFKKIIHYPIPKEVRNG